MDTAIATTEAPPEIAADRWSMRRLWKDCVSVGTASVFSDGLGIVTSLSLRFLIDPAEMGLWQGCKMLLSYGNFASLGASKAAGRELAIANGRGDQASATRSSGVALAVNTWTSALYGLCLIVAGCWVGAAQAGQFSSAWSLGLIATGAICVLQRHVTYQVTLLRCRQQFELTSRLTMFEAVLGLVASIACVWLWGWQGLLVSMAIVLCGSWWFMRHHRVPVVPWHWDRREATRLMAAGFPILLTGLLATLFRSLDRWMILSCSEGRELALGNYSLALMVVGQLYGLGNALGIVMLPKLAEMFGKTGNAKAVAQFSARSSELFALGLGLLSSLAVLVGPPVLGAILPKYRDGLEPMIWLVPGTVMLVLALPAGQFLIAINRQWTMVLAQSIAIVVGIAADFLALRSGYGIEGVAIATSGSYAIYYIVLLAMSVGQHLHVNQLVRHVLSISAVLSCTLLPACTIALRRTVDIPVMVVLAVAVACALVGGAIWNSGWWRASRHESL